MLAEDWNNEVLTGLCKRDDSYPPIVGAFRAADQGAKSHVTQDRYIKAFDPAVMAAMKELEATVDLVNQSAPRVHQIQ